MQAYKLALPLILTAVLSLTIQAARAEQQTFQLTITSQLENGDPVQGNLQSSCLAK